MNCACAIIGSCDILNITQSTAKIILGSNNLSACCSSGLTTENTYITIRRDGPVYTQQPSWGGCANPIHHVDDCPILPGQLSFPFPTYIVPCPDLAPVPGVSDCTVWYKYPPFVKYPLFEKKGTELVFFLDDIFYSAPKGRYIVDVVIAGERCSSIKLKYDKGCKIVSKRKEDVTGPICRDNNPAPSCEC